MITIQKNTFTKRLRKYFNLHHSACVTHLTSSLLKEAIVFTDGFLACIKIVGEDPIREEELENVIFEQTVNYIIQKIDNR